MRLAKSLPRRKHEKMPEADRSETGASLAKVWLWNAAGFIQLDGLPLWDRGFRYGMAVFESLRCSPGHAWFSKEHFGKLRRTAEALGWPLHSDWEVPAETLLRTRSEEGFARVYLTAGDGSPSAPIVNPRIILFFEPRARVLPGSYSLSADSTPFQPVLQGCKTGAYWPHILALCAALDHGAQETLLFNAKGLLLGCAMANVFLRISGKWRTPPPGTGAREGIIREWVMNGLPVEEELVTRDESRAAEAAFISSSWLGIMPVHSICGRKVSIPEDVVFLRRKLEDFCT